MNAQHEVISDFLDGEGFDPRALGEALADPAGRDLLIDFVVLRYAAQAENVGAVSQVVAPRLRRGRLLAAAAVLVALAAGYQIGQRQPATDSVRPPEATRVVQVEWQRVPEEGVK